MQATNSEALHESGCKDRRTQAPTHFGARLLPDGDGVSFRFFAPACKHVELKVEGESAPRMMRADGHGWHGLVVPEARPGTRYRFLLPDGMEVPDPASRFQPEDIAGPSEVIDPHAFSWTDAGWRGTPWHDAVLYELHVGTYTPEGTFRAAIATLDHLCSLGITAIELMTISDFAGKRNWGYDTVLLYAPDSAYGHPDDLKALIDAAHARGLMVILDVVYNHFGPEGNHLPSYFPQILSKKHTTAWGPALNFDGECSRETREFILANALYWIEEFHVDGLRLDAAHAMIDESPKHILDELAERVHAAAKGRHIHLILENEGNIARRLERTSDGCCTCYTAQWNHDIDHLLGAAFQGDKDERIADDQGETERLGKSISEGFVIAAQMKKDAFETGCHVPPTAFIGFIQSHDLVGNRVFGDRIFAVLSREAVRAIVTVYLLLPQIPMLFMGEEWGASSPFPYFCDFHGALSEDVQRGRCEQLSKLPGVSEEDLQHAPNCQAESTFLSAKLRWEEIATAPHSEWLQFYRDLLRVRRRNVAPLLATLTERCGQFQIVGPGGLIVEWQLTGARLRLCANLWHAAREGFPKTEHGRTLWLEGSESEHGLLSAWAVRWEIIESASNEKEQA